jgi:hypothetical protein
MIPDEAVEAVARLNYEDEWGDDWDKQVPSYCEIYRKRARRILEAAAPHLMAIAWDEGYEAGYDRGEWDAAPIRKEPIQENPYRKDEDAK